MVTNVSTTITGGKSADTIDLNYTDTSGNSVSDDAAGHDIVHGQNGADKIFLYAGDDTAFGGAKDDTIYGMKGQNELHGGTGNDVIYSGRNTSELFGDDGNDRLVADLDKGADHVLTGGNGDDIFELTRLSDTKTSAVVVRDFTFGQDTLIVGGVSLASAADFDAYEITADAAGNAIVHVGDDETITLEGVAATTFAGYTPAPDGAGTEGAGTEGIVDGTSGDDFIGLSYTDAEGDKVTDDAAIGDVVHAGAGDDVVYLHAGDDTALGQDGNDQLYGSQGNDFLFGGGGDDKIFGYDGDDTIGGGAGNDELKGYAGADFIRGGSGDDILHGYADNDRLYGDRGNDQVFGGGGNDQVFGIEGQNILDGGAGDDFVHSGQNSSTLRGGTGDDILVARLDKGADHTLTGGAGSDQFKLQLAATDATSSVLVTDFDPSKDVLVIGNTVVTGSTLPAGVTVSDNAAGDIVLHFSDDETVTLTGVSQADFGISGGPSEPSRGIVIDGTDGDDLINAVYVDPQGESYNTNGDPLTVEAGAGNDTVHLLNAADFANGGAGNDTMYGYAGDDRLFGGDGNDELHGYTGNDFLGGNAGNDTLLGYVGDDTLRGGAGDDVLRGHAGNDTLFGDRGNDDLNGGDGNDILWGINGNNLLYGGDGDDQIHSGRDTSDLRGGAGNDTLTARLIDGADHSLRGGFDADSFVLTDASDTETSNVTIHDFVVGVDSLTIGDTVINGASLPSGVAASQNADGDVVLSFLDDETVTLKGVSQAAFEGGTSAARSSGSNVVDELTTTDDQAAAAAQAQVQDDLSDDGIDDPFQFVMF